MNLIFIVLNAIIGLSGIGLMMLIMSKVNNKRIACVLCYLLGVAVTIGVTFLLIHSGDAVSIGMIG